LAEEVVTGDQFETVFKPRMKQFLNPKFIAKSRIETKLGLLNCDRAVPLLRGGSR
jgi:hypothetical protein